MKLRNELAKRKAHYQELITAIDLLVGELNADEPKNVGDVVTHLGGNIVGDVVTHLGGNIKTVTRTPIQHNLSTLQELIPTDSVVHIGKRLIPALLHYVNFDDPQEWPDRIFGAPELQRIFKKRGLHMNKRQAANVCNSLYYRKILKSSRRAGGTGNYALYTIAPKSEWKVSQ